jgi:hypothetical protein
MILKYKFVVNIPEKLDKETIYISVKYCTAVHKCICGCDNEVVTPLSPTDWELSFNGKSVSLYPSIGNWNFDCKSHYWIVNNMVKLAENWNNFEIEQGRQRDKNIKLKYYEKRKKSNKLLFLFDRVRLYLKNHF